MEQKVLNPKTNRLINVGGSTYNRLVAEGVLPQSPTPKYMPPSPNPLPSPKYMPSSPNPPVKITPYSNPQTIIKSNPIIVNPNTIPNINTFTTTIDQKIQEETDEKKKVCKVCDELYVDRIKNLRPFKEEELPILKKIRDNCKRCHTLHTYSDSRSGSTSKETLFYKNASDSCETKIKELENKLASDTVKFLHSPAIPKRPDIDFLFPKVPK